MAKAGRPKHVRPNDIQLHVPVSDIMGLKNRCKRLYWALLEMEKRMSKDITSVRMKDYTDLVTAYEQACKELRKAGHVGKHAKQRVDVQGVGENGRQDGSATVGGNRSPGVGTGVPAVNPLA